MGTPDEPLEKLEPTPYLSTDFYLNRSIVFPKGDRLPQGKFVRFKRDVDGNPIGRENQNTIIDTRHYKVDFTNGEVIDLTYDVIADGVYDQFEKNGNDMFLLNYFVDYINT